MFKVNDKATIFLHGFRTQFGGGKSTGFGLIYDNMEVAKKLVSKHLLVRVRLRRSRARRWRRAGNSHQFLQAGVTARVTKSRKQTKERKNRSAKVRGVKKVRLPALRHAPAVRTQSWP